MNKILVVIDMQEDFTRGALGSPAAEATIPVIAELAYEARGQEFPIFYSRDTHFSDYLSTEEGKHLSVSHCLKNSDGWEICPEVIDYDYWNNIIIDKYTFGFDNWGAFSDQFDSADEIVIVGLVSSICVISNIAILRACYPEVPMTLVAAATAGLSDENNAAALEVARSLQVNVVEGEYHL